MPPIRARAILSPAWALFAAATLMGCASDRLSPEPPPGERLAGDWKLDVSRSDDLGRAVGELHALSVKARQRDAHTAPRQAPGNPAPRGRRGGDPDDQQEAPPGGQTADDDSSQGPDGGGLGVGVGPPPRASPVDELMSNVPRGEYLRIKVSPSSFTVVSGDSTDEYTPGLESEISAVRGDAQQISGWKGADYVIDTKPQWGAEIITTYTLTKDGRLMMRLHLAGDRIKFTFTRVYDRTTRVAPLAPPTIN